MALKDFKIWQLMILGLLLSIVLGISGSTFFYYTIASFNQNKKILYQNLNSQVIKMRTDIDILKGQMKTYENIPIIFESRIGVLEDRYDNIIFFRKRMNESNKEND